MDSSSYVITEAGDRLNMYATESRPYIDTSYAGYAKEAELANARWAMIGFVAAIGAYVTTGQILPGVF